MIIEKEKLKVLIENLKNQIFELKNSKEITNYDLIKVFKLIKIEDKEIVLKLSHDLLEVSVNQTIFEKYSQIKPSNLDESLEILHELQKLENVIPVKSWRSSEQQLMQQLSTPPQIAFVMIKLLNPTGEDLILEPSAGTGSLAVWLKLMGCKMHLNEISELRRTLLELQGYQPTSNNAEFINDLLPPEIIPDGVMMNPPFSTTAGRVKRKDSNFGFRHIKSAISRLKKTGKMVALFSTDALRNSNKGKRFIKELKDEYCLKALIDLPKNVYYKYGTNIQTTIICLQKQKPPEGTGNTININCSTLAEVLQFTNLFDQKSEENLTHTQLNNAK